MTNKLIVLIFWLVLVFFFLIDNTKIKDFKTIDVSYSTLTSKSKKQVECLTQNIFFEAGAEPPKGQLAVAMVTMKRTISSAYPDNVCGVVRQKINNTCQFSWWCDKKLQQKAIAYNYNQNEKQLYKQIRRVAMEAYLNYDEIEDPTHGAMFYHATYVDPKWKLKKTTKIGNHIFYKRS